MYPTHHWLRKQLGVSEKCTYTTVINICVKDMCVKVITEHIKEKPMTGKLKAWLWLLMWLTHCIVYSQTTTIPIKGREYCKLELIDPILIIPRLGRHYVCPTLVEIFVSLRSFKIPQHFQFCQYATIRQYKKCLSKNINSTKLVVSARYNHKYVIMNQNVTSALVEIRNLTEKINNLDLVQSELDNFLKNSEFECEARFSRHHHVIWWPTLAKKCSSPKIHKKIRDHVYFLKCLFNLITFFTTLVFITLEKSKKSPHIRQRHMYSTVSILAVNQLSIMATLITEWKIKKIILEGLYELRIILYYYKLIMAILKSMNIIKFKYDHSSLCTFMTTLLLFVVMEIVMAITHLYAKYIELSLQLITFTLAIGYITRKLKTMAKFHDNRKISLYVILCQIMTLITSNLLIYFGKENFIDFIAIVSAISNSFLVSYFYHYKYTKKRELARVKAKRKYLSAHMGTSFV